MNRIASNLLLLLFTALAACGEHEPTPDGTLEESPMDRVDIYTPFRLDADLSGLTTDQQRAVALLIEAAGAANDIFWQQAYGERNELLNAVDDPELQRFVQINFGPWDRLADNEPFIEGVGPKPPGANFYPIDMTEEAFEAAAAETPALRDPYTMVRWDEEGQLSPIPYHQYFADQVESIASKLDEAAALDVDPGLKRYLALRAEAIRTDDYFESDMAWMDMKDNRIEVVIGPIENYEDQLFGYKTSYETFVLLKDSAWSARLSRYAALLPALQEGLPVPDAYKQESPGTDSDLGAYDVLYTAGDANAGSKTIAINLPNDEQVQLQKGTRRLQLKNAMQAKFENILVPIADLLIDEAQREHITFDAFFGNTMFHEVAHGLGVKNVIAGSGTVREALRNQYTTMEEGKADVLGLYMVTELIDQGEWDANLADHYTTFLASIFRSVRFGGASAHGRANLIRFNFFKEQGAFVRDEETGTYRVVPEAMAQSVDALSERILTLQGDGDFDAVEAFVETYSETDPQLQADLDRLNAAGIPVDIRYEQGLSQLGLEGVLAAR